MGIKKKIIPLLSVFLMISSMNVTTFAQTDGNEDSFIISNAPIGAVYSIYEDTEMNYIYDTASDPFVTFFVCDKSGKGSVSGLDAGNYVAVLESEDSDIISDCNKEYAFSYDGINCEIQEAFYIKEESQNKQSFNSVSTSDDSETAINIQYDVPLFKQSGPLATEWSSLKVNGSSDTMGWVGCLICSFAMMRSYETGQYIYPNEMMNTYSSDTNIGVVFSSGANMNVPASANNYDWTVYGNSGSYGGNGEIANNQVGTQALYKLLYERLQNAPVIFGGYSTPNKRGSTNHWVVVTGYHGDGVNFSASDFTICDPANNNGYNRTTLAEYSQSYPYWDRLIYNENLEVIAGDINLDGDVTFLDLLMLKRYILNLCDLMGVSLQAADVDNNGSVGAFDLISLKKRFLYE